MEGNNEKKKRELSCGLWIPTFYTWNIAWIAMITSHIFGVTLQK